MLNPFTIFPNVIVDASQTASIGGRGPAVTVFDSTTAAAAARLEIMLQLSDEVILHRGKPAKPDATTKWAHALQSKFPELTNKSDAELGDIVRHMRER
jgi:hypothetical protein